MMSSIFVASFKGSRGMEVLAESIVPITALLLLRSLLALNTIGDESGTDMVV